MGRTCRTCIGSSAALPPTLAEMMQDGNLIGIIADEDTLTGFLLTGMGETTDETNETNYMLVHGETEQMDIQIKFVEMTCRDDLTIILINQWVADKIPEALAEYGESIPAVVVIPTKDKPYDPDNDPLYSRINNLLK